MKNKNHDELVADNSLVAATDFARNRPISKTTPFADISVGVESWLDELKNDITRETPASFEPSIDSVVTKIPRFAFEKFPQAARRFAAPSGAKSL